MDYKFWSFIMNIYCCWLKMDSLKKILTNFVSKRTQKYWQIRIRQLNGTYTIIWVNFFFRSVSSFPPKPQESLLFSFGELLSNLMVYVLHSKWLFFLERTRHLTMAIIYLLCTKNMHQNTKICGQFITQQKFLIIFAFFKQ